MPRRPLVIAILTLVAAIVVVPIVLLAPAGSRPLTPSPPPGASQEPDPAAVEALRAEQVRWAYAAPLFEGPAAGMYTLQAGVLGEPLPIVDLQVPFGLDPNSNPGRVPAVGRVVGGAVVHVADDGRRASLRRVAVAPDAVPEELAVLDQIVYSLAVAPDGAHAYLALGDRADPERDLGIVRVSLDGQARVEPVFDAAAGARLQRGFMLAAIAPFSVQIDLSVDGRHLVRYACAGPAGCAAQVIDVESGGATPIGDVVPMAVASGIVLTQRCGAVCELEVIDLATGASERIAGAAFGGTITMVDGRPLVAFIDQASGASVLRALDPADGSVTEVFRAPDGASISIGAWTIAPGMGGPGPGISLPDGYVLTTISGEDVGAIVEMHAVAIRLDGGDAVELPPMPIRHEFPGING